MAKVHPDRGLDPELLPSGPAFSFLRKRKLRPEKRLAQDHVGSNLDLVTPGLGGRRKSHGYFFFSECGVIGNVSQIRTEKSQMAHLTSGPRFLCLAFFKERPVVQGPVTSVPGPKLLLPLAPSIQRAGAIRTGVQMQWKCHILVFPKGPRPFLALPSSSAPTWVDLGPVTTSEDAWSVSTQDLPRFR